MAIVDINRERTTSGGYNRQTGNSDIANLITACHAALISNGTKVGEKLERSYLGNLPIYSGKDVNTPNKTLKVIKNNSTGVIILNGFIKDKNNKKQELDMLIYDGKTIYIYELKDGDNLDTKKSAAEIDNIEYAVNHLKLIGYNNIKGGLVLLHMRNSVHSIKDSRAEDYVKSGYDFCKKHSFDFDEFINIQKNEAPTNEKIVLDEMVRIVKKYRGL